MDDAYFEAEERWINSFFSLDALFAKAAAYKGLKLAKGNTRNSEYLGKVQLDAKLLTALEKLGIKRNQRLDEILTLVDENPYPTTPGFSQSNYWNFREKERDGRKPDLNIDLFVQLQLSNVNRGFMLVPRTMGSVLGPCDHLPNFRMFRAVVQNSPKETFPAIAKELAESEGHIIVSWTDLGLGGIRSTGELFHEFFGHREKIVELSHRENVFHPKPRSAEITYVIESAQPAVVKTWRKQLETYRNFLAD